MLVFPLARNAPPQQEALRKLHNRNSRALARNPHLDQNAQIQLPFILVTSKNHTEIECNVRRCPSAQQNMLFSLVVCVLTLFLPHISSWGARR